MRPGVRPGQTPEQRAAELKRRHVEARRRQARRRRTWLAVALATILLTVVAGVVAVRAFGPREAGSGPAAAAAAAATYPPPSADAGAGLPSSASTAADTSPTADAGNESQAGAGQTASTAKNQAKTPPATPTADATPTGTATATAKAAAIDEATPTAQDSPTPSPAPKPRFVVSRALADVRALEHIGVRSSGGSGETRGAAFITRRLLAAGATPETRSFRLPNGRTSRNVVVRFPGATRKTIILGAHMDTKAPSPGANDNGSGCGALLEIARCLAQRKAYATVELVFFGAEEMIDANPDHHHFGSRFHVKDMSAGARKNAAGMISVDMIGYGPSFVVRSMGTGPQTMVDLLLQQAKKRSLRLSYLRDPGASGWSDHEAFERAGIPAAWIEWRDDPVYHTSADTSGHLVTAKLRAAGQFVLGVVYGMDAAALARMAR
jgi:aminopeptidase YwaD